MEPKVVLFMISNREVNGLAEIVALPVSEIRPKMNSLVELLEREDRIYVVTSRGRGKAVLLSLDRYNSLIRALEDLDDLLAFYRKESEEAVSFQEYDLDRVGQRSEGWQDPAAEATDKNV